MHLQKSNVEHFQQLIKGTARLPFAKNIQKLRAELFARVFPRKSAFLHFLDKWEHVGPLYLNM